MPTAMIIDDMETIRIILVRLFACCGWVATEFGDAEAALAAFSPGAFDLVLCDINLGEKRDGLLVVKELLARDPSLRVVLMSGDLREMDRARESSVRFIGKPFDAQTISSLCDWAKRPLEGSHEH